MNKKLFNIQDLMLQQAKEEKLALKIFLVRGLMLQGTVVAYDNFTVLIDGQGKLQLIYKHSISTIDFPAGFRFKFPTEESWKKACYHKNYDFFR